MHKQTGKNDNQMQLFCRRQFSMHTYSLSIELIRWHMKHEPIIFSPSEMATVFPYLQRLSMNIKQTSINHCFQIGKT